MAEIVIGLDAGHGGSSSGTYSCNTTKDNMWEKDFTLELCKMVAERLKYNGFGVYMTRTTDINPGTVVERAEMCMKANCKYAVSLHFNGFEKESANGVEVFVPHAETGAGIEAGFSNYLGKFFKHRAPFAKSSAISNHNEIFDKKLNISTRKFEAATSAKKDYFGFIRTAWAKGFSYDLLEVCFLTNKNDFNTYMQNKAAIADAIARSIVEGYKKSYVPLPVVEVEKKEKYRVIAGSYDIRENADLRVSELKAAGFESFVSKEIV